MKASKFTDAQKAFVIKQGEEGVPVAEVCRKAGISQATYFAWKKKYAGLMPSEMRRLKQLEEENSRLRSGLSPTSRSTRRCCRISSAESCEAWSQASARRRGAYRVEGVDPTRLRGRRRCEIDLPLRFCATRPGQSQKTHSGDRGSACALRLSADSRVALSRGMAREREADLSTLLRRTPATAQENAAAAREGGAAR